MQALWRWASRRAISPPRRATKFDPIRALRYFSSVAYRLVEALRRLGLAGREWARAQWGPLRLRRLKIGAPIRVTGRRVWISRAEGSAYAALFAHVYAPRRALPLRC